jgi:hypothetical protein
MCLLTFFYLFLFVVVAFFFFFKYFYHLICFAGVYAFGFLFMLPQLFLNYKVRNPSVKCWCRGGDKLFKTLAKLASGPAFSLAKTEKQLAKNIERFSERGKNSHQTGEWVCSFTRQSWILLAFGEWLSALCWCWRIKGSNQHNIQSTMTTQARLVFLHSKRGIARLLFYLNMWFVGV